MNDIERVVIKSAAIAYGVNEADINLDTKPNELSKISIKMVTFLSNIEEELDVYIAPRTAMRLETLKDFVEFISAKKQ